MVSLLHEKKKKKAETNLKQYHRFVNESHSHSFYGFWFLYCIKPETNLKQYHRLVNEPIPIRFMFFVSLLQLFIIISVIKKIFFPTAVFRFYSFSFLLVSNLVLFVSGCYNFLFCSFLQYKYCNTETRKNWNKFDSNIFFLFVLQ